MAGSKTHQTLDTKTLGQESQAFQRMLRTNVALPIFLILLLCAVYVFQVVFLLGQNKEIVRMDQSIASINRMLNLMVDAETGMRGFILNGQEIFLEPFLLSKSELPAVFAQTKALVGDDPAQLDLLRQVEATFTVWRELAEQRNAEVRAGKSVSNEQALQGKTYMDQIRSLVQSLLAAEQRGREESSQRTESSAKLVLVLTFAGGSIVALLLAYLGRRQLFTLAESFESALSTTQEQNQQLSEQAWLRTGQSELLASVRGDLDEEQVGAQILRFMNRYVHCDLSAIYGRSNADGRLKRLAAIGLDGNSLKTRAAFAPGEGILGKAASEQRTLIVADLPQDYLTFSTSLGSTPVARLAIAPLRTRGETVALLELGFLRDPEQVDRIKDLLDTISEPLGTIIHATYLRTRQKTLFEETQQLNEELQAQQEELRVSNEELEQQASILKESQVRLETQQVDLEESNSKLEAQASLLKEKARELSVASRYKSEFLANMSHELRTPLNSSLILAKLLADNASGNLNPEQVEFAETIYSAGNDLLTLINDILDLAKVEAGQLALHPETVGLRSVCENLKRTFSPLADKKDLDFTIEISPDAPASFESDRVRLEQVLRNLLSNAIKFTERGSVRLGISPGKGGSILFRVSDTGIGIPPSQQEAIFEPFRQADGTTNRKYGGTGLGLSISRELAQLLGGAIRVRSTPGEGSEFEIELPLRLPDAKARTPGTAKVPLRESLPPRQVAEAGEVLEERSGSADDDRATLSPDKSTILIVEDDPEFAKNLFRLAKEQGYQCLVAHTGKSGIELAQNFKPRAILLDVGLPDQTGMSVLDALKDNLQTRHIPVHVISAHDYSQTAMEMGAVGYMLKPVKREEVAQAFKKLEGKFSQVIKQVLIIEDDSAQRMGIEALIAVNNTKCVHAEDGKRALELLQTDKFDCVILDLSLPDMSGFELLEQMSNLTGISFPPVIVYTGRDLSREEEIRLRKHSNSIIVKGARSPERLLDEVSLFLHQMESELPPEKRKMIQSVKNRDKLLEGKTVLLVDDDSRNLFALMHVLEPRGAKVEVARNGKEALQALRKLAHVDLVLMDIMMPEMDGYEAIREIRKDPRTSGIPVIAVTAKAMSADYEKCLEAGANDYLAKPLDVTRLLSLIKVWLHRAAKD